VSTIGVKDAVEDDDEVVSYAEPSKGVYKKLIVRGDRVAGAIVIGDGAIVPSLRQAFEDDTPLAGVRGELLFAASDRQAAPIDASLMPDTTRVCDCNAVTKAAIVEAVLAGARSVGAVSERTRACTGCGSCRPEVERIIALACEAAVAPEVLAHALPEAPAARPPLPRDASLVPQNKIERLKSEKDGLEILPEIPQLAGQPWQAIAEPDRERLKWAGVFFRKQTPGQFMMRVRIPNGLTNAVQIRALAGIAAEFGPGFLDITTRQQVQLRGFGIERVPEIWRRLEETGLGSLQTGMDNVRNVIGCALAGLDAHELLDASPVVREFTEMIVGNREFSNLPRKFNVGISGCRHHCTHAETQDLALTPAIAAAGGTKTAGFNVAVGGKMGSGGYRIATPLDVFVRPEDAAALCTAVTSIFRDYGSRAVRTRARLAFLIEEWGAAGFRDELARRVGRPLEAAGEDARTLKSSDHLGVSAQKQAGLNAVGLAVPVGRVAAAQLTELARLADDYGSGDIRITTSQNVIIVNVPAERVRPLLAEPLLGVLSADPHGAVRGLVSCTGIDYCHFALIETKELAVKTAQHLAHSLPHGKRLTMHWSGCPAGCGNHAAADIGLLGKNVRIDGETVDAVDVFVGGKAGPSAKAGVKVLEDVPCSDLPRVLEQVIPYLTGRRLATHADAPIPFPARVVAAPRDAASQSSRADT
jgi:ferredoxin-nitrite reductase